MYLHIKAIHHARQSYGLYGVVIKRQQGRAHENQIGYTPAVYLQISCQEQNQLQILIRFWFKILFVLAYRWHVYTRN